MFNDFLTWLRQNEGATEGFQGPFFPRMPPPTPVMPGPPPMMGVPAPRGYGGMGPLEPVPPSGDGSTPEGPPELPFGLNPQTLAPFARSMMPAVPGVGPMSRNPDQYFAEANQPTRISVGKPTRQPAPAGMPSPQPQPGIWQQGAPPAPSATTSAPQPQMPAAPGFFGRNKELIGDIGGALSSFGQGISQTPPGAGWMTGLNLGASNASRYAQGLGESKLNERYKKAQIGEIETKAEQRKATIAFADTIKDPTARNYMKLGMTEKALDRLKDIDPDERQRVIDFEVAKQNALMPGKIAIAQAGKTDVSVKVGSEYQAKVDNLAKFDAIAADSTKSPAERKNAADMAQGIRRDITQKDTPDKAFLDQITGMERGVQGAERLRELVKQHGVSSLDPDARAKIGQEYSWLITAMKSTEGFGAALTGNEQKILEDGLRNPNNFLSNALIGSKTHLALINKYINYTKGRAQSLDRLRRSGELPSSLRDETGLPPPPAGYNRIR